MANYIRSKTPGAYYFFTLVTHDRIPHFNQSEARKCLKHSMLYVKNRKPFEIIALCLLPDHLHCVWKLPSGDNQFSIRWGMIKSIFTREYKKHLYFKENIKFWQRRFWEHTIVDENDLSRHIDYTHFNPLKHNLVEDLLDWKWSTFHKYLNNGYYRGTDIMKKYEETKNLSTGYE